MALYPSAGGFIFTITRIRINFSRAHKLTGIRLFVQIIPQSNGTVMSQNDPSKAVGSSDAMKTMRKLVDVNQPSSWNNAWSVSIQSSSPITNRFIREAKVTPWDAGEIQPPLREAIEVNVDKVQWPEAGKALVPGCGGVSGSRKRSTLS